MTVSVMLEMLGAAKSRSIARQVVTGTVQVAQARRFQQFMQKQKRGRIKKPPHKDVNINKPIFKGFSCVPVTVMVASLQPWYCSSAALCNLLCRLIGLPMKTNRFALFINGMPPIIIPIPPVIIFICIIELWLQPIITLLQNISQFIRKWDIRTMRFLSTVLASIKIKRMGLNGSGIHNSKNIKKMQGDTGDSILQYPQYCTQDVAHFIKRMPLEQFKQVDIKRIRSEFSVQQSIQRITNYNKVMHLGEKQKDRYSNIHTYKHNRVVIEGMDNFYINASYMKSVLDEQVYAVFAQAPVEKVYDHFWWACYRLKIRKIVMLCSFEDPHRGRQAEKYWPELGKSFHYADLKLKVTCQARENASEEHTKTTIVLDGPQGSFSLQHIHWTGWSDMKKPFGQKNQGLFRNLVEDSLRLIDNKELILIHCSAGIGRTGTLGTMIQALRCAKREKSLSVFEIVDNMRRHRMACVQTFEQYSFIYQQLKVML